jgi:hypothetical protein
MAIYLPMPFDDELFSGLIFRYISMLGVKFYSHFRGARDMARGLRLPRLQTLDWWSEETHRSLGLSGLEIAMRHTTLPFYSALRVGIDSTEAYEKIQSHNVRPTLLIPRELRFCGQCFREDRLIGRRAYWRRSHQLPGALYCHIHQVPLYQTRKDMEGTALYDIATAEETGVRFELDVNDAQRTNIVAVAKLTNWILSNRSAYCGRVGGSRYFCEYAVPGRETQRTFVSSNVAPARYLAHYGESYIDKCATMFGARCVARIKSRSRGPYVKRENMDLLLRHAMLKQSWDLAWPKCVNLSAAHGPDYRVSSVARLNDRWVATCECGCTFEYVRVPIEAGVRFEVTAMKLPNVGSD